MLPNSTSSLPVVTTLHTFLFRADESYPQLFTSLVFVFAKSTKYPNLASTHHYFAEPKFVGLVVGNNDGWVDTTLGPTLVMNGCWNGSIGSVGGSLARNRQFRVCHFCGFVAKIMPQWTVHRGGPSTKRFLSRMSTHLMHFLTSVILLDFLYLLIVWWCLIFDSCFLLFRPLL